MNFIGKMNCKLKKFRKISLTNFNKVKKNE